MTKPSSANITSRRGAMKIGAAAVLAVSPVAALTAPAPAVDPIYAAIERHREAWAAFVRAIYANDSDKPATAAQAAETEINAKIDASHAELAQTFPTTVAGIAAVLAYVREMRIDGEELFSPGDLATWLLTLERAAAALTSA